MADGNIIQPFAFTGYQEDEVSGLKYVQARFYNARAGRFQSEDNVKGFTVSPFTQYLLLDMVEFTMLVM